MNILKPRFHKPGTKILEVRLSWRTAICQAGLYGGEGGSAAKSRLLSLIEDLVIMYLNPLSG